VHIAAFLVAEIAHRAEESLDQVARSRSASRDPTTGIACCARAASGHAAEPSRSVMKSRLFIR
jgi:hypothetical protein